MSQKLIWSDGWLLCSIAGTYGDKRHPDRPKTKHYVQAVGDMLNVAILTDDEIERGIKRLAAAGLAGQNPDGTYFCTESGLELTSRYWAEYGFRDGMLELAKHPSNQS